RSAGLLEGDQPIPFEERRAVADPDDPGVPRHLADGVVHAQRGHRIDFTQPPSTSMQAPVIQDARSEQSSATMAAVSSGSPKRPAGSGRRAPKYSSNTRRGSSAVRPLRRTADAIAASVRVMPGQTQLVSTPRPE